MSTSIVRKKTVVVKYNIIRYLKKKIIRLNKIFNLSKNF